MANLQSKYMDEDEEEDEQSKTTTIAAVAITELERGAGIGPEQSGTGNRVGPRVSGNERLPGAVMLARERLLRKPGDAGHCIYIGVVYLVMVIALPNLEVHELHELPEQWRRFKLAWLCKELPSHNSGALIRILNAQKKWMRQEDAKNSGKRTLKVAG